MTHESCGGRGRVGHDSRVMWGGVKCSHLLTAVMLRPSHVLTLVMLGPSHVLTLLMLGPASASSTCRISSQDDDTTSLGGGVAGQQAGVSTGAVPGSSSGGGCSSTSAAAAAGAGCSLQVCIGQVVWGEHGLCGACSTGRRAGFHTKKCDFWKVWLLERDCRKLWLLKSVIAGTCDCRKVWLLESVVAG